jgi:hypothetical protein
MSVDPSVYDPAREPFAEGIDRRVLADPHRPAGDHRQQGPGSDVRRAAWPPPSQGPLPAELPPDFSLFTALDELDAWRVAYDAAETELAEARRQFKRQKREYELQQALARRTARQNPNERGRRTDGDISAEVVEATHQPGGPYDQYLEAETRLEVATTAYFAAAKQIDALEVHVRAAGRYNPHGT